MSQSDTASIRPGAMQDRVVVCFRWRGSSSRSNEGGAFLPAADLVSRRAAALGGRVVAWHVVSFAFDFPGDALEDAIELVAGEDPGEADGRPVPWGFGVGIAQGPLEPFVEDSRVALCWGPALSRGNALSRVAKSGEVLLDPNLPAVRSGRLLTTGSRLGMLGRERVRGLRLDLAHPLRERLGASVDRLEVAPRYGAVSPRSVPLQPGELSVIRAPRGAGGTRFLDDLVEELGAPPLGISPHPPGEPLGALRFAMRRMLALDPERHLLPQHSASLESLLGGEGLDIDAASALIAEWLGAQPPGLTVIDDAGLTDYDTLSAIARACQAKRIRLAVRIEADAELPAPLAELELVSEIMLAPLSAADATELTRSSLGGALDAKAARRYARRGECTPLGIREALLEALESGELVGGEELLKPRLRRAGRGRTGPAEHWLERRLRFVDPVARKLLDLLAVLGGQVEFEVVKHCYEELDWRLDQLDDSVKRLNERRWLRTPPDMLALPSRTHQWALAGLLDEASRARLHRAAALTYDSSIEPLAAATASLHFALAGKPDRARSAAHRASLSCRAAGLNETALALASFAENGDAKALAGRGLIGPFTLADLPLKPIESQPPRFGPGGERADLMRDIGPDSERAPLNDAARALRSGDHAALEQLVSKLRDDGGAPLLADRLSAMTQLARGQVGDALRMLREAKDRARELSAVDRCRAALALGIGLAAAGRPPEALLEGLEGLARAREASDARGQQACARFLAQLSRGAGQPGSAERWDRLAQGG